MTESYNIADVALRITGAALSSLAERDARADGRQREIFCAPGLITIKRRVHGIPMQIDAPAHQYMGVALSIFEGSDGLPFFRISMPHGDPDLAIVLFEARDDRDVVAVWKAWAQFFALPRILERRPGEIEFCDRRLGATAMGERPRWRRRGGALAKRKPKLLNRRRAAHGLIKTNRPPCATASAGDV